MKLLLYIICLCCLRNVLLSQSTDTLTLINHKYDSILKSDDRALEFLFYKHFDDVLINNLGVYNSLSFFPTVTIHPNNIFNSQRTIGYINLPFIKPFTNISYINASRKEQIFSINHSQQFGKAIDFGFQLNKTSSPGDYVNQSVNTSDFIANLTYRNKKKSYIVDFKLFFNRLKQEENGGLSDINEFEDNLVVNPLSASIFLTNSNVQVTKYLYELNQKINISSFNDKATYLKLNSSYNTNQRMFYDNDPLSSLYNDIFIDTLATVDSIYSNSFENLAGIGVGNNINFFELFISHSWNNYFQSFGLDTSYSNSFIGGVFTKRIKRMDINFSTKYGVYGYRKNDYYGIFKFEYRFLNRIKINSSASYSLIEPELKHINYASNHFKWKNTDFSKQSIAHIDAALVFEKYNLEFNSSVKFINDALFYNSFAVASQLNSSSTIGSVKVSKKYKLGNFHFKTALFYQQTTNDFIFPLPDFIGRQLVYYETFAFKKVLKMQFGFNVSYNSSYYGYAYTPSLTEFYVQNNQKIGNYPFVDIFINMHLKRAQLFLKYEHFNSGWNGYEFYATANYPALTRSLKFGISWNLVD